MPVNDIRYTLEHAPVLAEFMRSRKPQVEGLMGPFGSGKSSGCLMKLVALTHEMPPMRDGIRRARWAVVRNTYKQLEDTTMRTAFTWFPEVSWGKYRQRDHSYLIDQFDGVEIELIFRALDRPDHVQNLLSLEVTGSWVNEAREIPREIIGPLFGRGGRFPQRAEVGPYKRRMLMDTNPPDTNSWWYHEFEEVRRRKWKLFKQPSGRSPEAENLPFLDPDYYSDMVDVMTEDEVRVYVDGEYGYLQTGKPVYPEYRDQWHCAEFDVKRELILRCWDFGLTPACVFLQLHPTGQVRVIDEVCADRAGIASFAPVVQAHTNKHYPWAKYADRTLRDIGDPAGKTAAQTDERSCFDIMLNLGIDIEPGVQDVNWRLESVRTALMTAIDGQPGLLVHPRCKKLRQGFQGEYKYRRMLIGGTNARYHEKPEKNEFSHPHDALQYGVLDILGDRVRGWRDPPGSRRQVAAESAFDPLEHIEQPADLQHEQAYADADFDPFNL